MAGYSLYQYEAFGKRGATNCATRALVATTRVLCCGAKGPCCGNMRHRFGTNWPLPWPLGFGFLDLASWAWPWKIMFIFEWELKNAIVKTSVATIFGWEDKVLGFAGCVRNEEKCNIRPKKGHPPRVALLHKKMCFKMGWVGDTICLFFVYILLRDRNSIFVFGALKHYHTIIIFKIWVSQNI